MTEDEQMEWALELARLQRRGLRSQTLLMAAVLRRLMDKGLLTPADANEVVRECVDHSLSLAAALQPSHDQPTGAEIAPWGDVEDDVQEIAVLLRRLLDLPMS